MTGAQAGQFFSGELGAPAGIGKAATLAGGIVGGTVGGIGSAIGGIGSALGIGGGSEGPVFEIERGPGTAAQPCPFAGGSHLAPPEGAPEHWGAWTGVQPHGAPLAHTKGGGQLDYVKSASVPESWHLWQDGSRWTCVNGIEVAVQGGVATMAHPNGSLWQAPARVGLRYSDFVQVRAPGAHGQGNEPPPPPPGPGPGQTAGLRPTAPKMNLRPELIRSLANAQKPAAESSRDKLLWGLAFAAGLGLTVYMYRKAK